jgi:ankyrin repeat protein
MLLKNGAIVDAKDLSGRTSLDIAIASGDEELLELLRKSRPEVVPVSVRF